MAPEGVERALCGVAEERIHEVRWKAKQTFADGTTKADWDVGLRSRRCRPCAATVIASGDGDFSISALKALGTEVEAAGWPGR